MPLAELEAYIDKKGHLPEMPTAEEVKEEGIKTGETLRLLTKKVDEIMLYCLQQQKETEQQQKEIVALKEKLEKTKTDENKKFISHSFLDGGDCTVRTVLYAG